MELANLVKTKIQLNELDPTSFLKEYEEYVLSLISVLSTCDAELVEFTESLQSNLNSLKQTVNNINAIADNLNNKIQSDIDEISKNWLKRGYLVEGGWTGSDNLPIDMERNNRSVIVNDIVKQKILATIQLYTSPRYPCLEIGPGDGIWTHYLVAGDPLYIVDILPEYLDSTKSKFPEPYQRRMRAYLLDYNDCFNLDVLPQNQFGFIFSWNVFDYFPLTETKQYLESCYKVLRPGGRMLFSYNNCDTVVGATHVECGNKSWMTKDLLIPACQEIGFEVELIENSFDSWICIKKPGELRTVKIHQALGELVNQDT